MPPAAKWSVSCRASIARGRASTAGTGLPPSASRACCPPSGAVVPLRDFDAAAKRAMDVMLAVAVLVLSSPLVLLTAALIRSRLGRPVFFRQMRIGLRDRPFRIWKFRTMTERVDARGRLLPDSERLPS